MKIEKFEDMIAWQKAEKLTSLVYEVFKNKPDYIYFNQLKKAAISVMNNIAEGFERYGDQEFKKFLFIAKGSCGEVRSMLYLAIKTQGITQEEYDKLNQLSIDISRLISGLLKKLNWK